jgi:ferritin
MRSFLPNRFPPIISIAAICLAYFLYSTSTVKKEHTVVVEKHMVAQNVTVKRKHISAPKPNALASLELQAFTINKCKGVGYRINKIQASKMANIDANILSAFCNPMYARR